MSDTKNGATSSGPSNGPTAGGRDNSGRFAAGNGGGPGNPFARQTAAARRAIAEAATREDLVAIMAALVKKAREGDVAAAKLVFSYAAGKPEPAPDPDTLDANELEVRRASTARVEDVQALFERCPAGLLCAIASVVAPRVRAHLEAAFAQGVRRQGEFEERDRKRAPDGPGPYHGRKADWAPSCVARGIPDEVEELFEACPPWMPDVTGADRLPHAYADLLRCMRRDLLDGLGRSSADPRQPATSTDSKRANRPGAATATCDP